MSHDWEAQKHEVTASLTEALYFFSNQNKLEREKYLVRQLLEANEVDFQEEELLKADEPVDIAFRHCNFQVKEILNEGRRRYDEFKESLARAEMAESWADLLELYTPRDLPVSDLIRLTMERARSLAERKYGPREVAVLDLLCYCNFHDACEIESVFELPQNAAFRSISVVSNRFQMVIYAKDTAPDFLASSVGILRSKVNEDAV